jgi:predicted aspartyl protease
VALLTVLLLSTSTVACVKIGPSAPKLHVTESDRIIVPTDRSSADLEGALRSLDAGFQVAQPSGLTERALLESIALIRQGELGAAADLLVATEFDGTAGAYGPVLRNQLLLHEGRWTEIQRFEGGTGQSGTLAAAYAVAGREEVEFDGDETAVPLFRTRVGTPVVEVAIGGSVRRFWVDTGAGLTVLSASLARELGLGEGPSPALTAGTATSRRVAARPVVIPEIRIGDAVRVRRHPAIILRDEDLQLRLAGVQVFRIDGILGWNFIRHLDLTLDHATGVAVIRRPQPDNRGPRNLLWHGYPVVVAHTEAGDELFFGLDTGAAASGLTPEFLAATQSDPSGTRTRRVGGAGGWERQVVETVDVAEIFVAGQHVRFEGVDVRPQTLAPVLTVHGVLGSDLAAKATIRIDWLNGRLEVLSR